MPPGRTVSLSPWSLLRLRSTRLVAPVLLVLLVGSACSRTGLDVTGSDSAEPARAAGSSGTGTLPGDTSGTDGSDDAQSSLAELVDELPAAPIGVPENEQAPRPVRLTIESLGVVDAVITDVGVEADGAMEVPPADEVGWYRHGPAPGEGGASILAAHIAYDGADGVFVGLIDIELGAVVEVADDAGGLNHYRVTSVDLIDKDALPDEVVFDRSGPSRLVLVTCGGTFDPDARSYEDNVVVVAEPI
jgi:sortase (surface protein transpeptidase)